MERQNNSVKIMIVGLLLSAIIVSGGCYLLQTKAGSAVTEVAKVEEVQEEVAESTYANSEYGFSLEFPSSWEGYQSEDRVLDWNELGTSPSVDFGFGEGTEFYSLFNISIHSKDQWTALKSMDGPMPTYLGETSQYVFGYSIAQDDINGSYAEKMDQISYIVSKIEIDGKLSESTTEDGNIVYNNTTYGYSLTYGPEWNIDAPGLNVTAADLSNSPSFSISQTDDTTGDMMNLSVNIRNDLSCTTLQECVDSINGLNGYESAEQKVVDFAGENAITEEINREEAGFMQITTVLFDRGELYEIDFVCSYDKYEEYKSVYDQVIGTFQFVAFM